MRRKLLLTFLVIVTLAIPLWATITGNGTTSTRRVGNSGVVDYISTGTSATACLETLTGYEVNDLQSIIFTVGSQSDKATTGILQVYVDPGPAALPAQYWLIQDMTDYSQCILVLTEELLVDKADSVVFSFDNETSKTWSIAGRYKAIQ